MATLEDLEARIAALEASHADYRAVLAAINAVGANQRDMTLEQRDQGKRLAFVESKLDDTNTRVRSLKENVGEIKDLLVRALDR
jgi:uncharacterized coiled-coil protein SlyX